MEKRHQFRKWMLALFTGMVLMLMAIPASAATQAQYKIVSAGECYHVLNKNISANKITDYTFSISKKTSDARYDLVLARYNTSTKKAAALAAKNCTINASSTNSAATYIKTNASANEGMIACVRVLKGQIQVKVQYKTTSTASGGKLIFGKMATGHSTFKGVTIPAGKYVTFKRTSANVDMPIVLAAKRGAEAKRYISGTKTCDWFGFGSSQYRYRAYNNGKRVQLTKRNYDTKYSTTGYVMTTWGKGANTNCRFRVTSGKVTFFYPSDYFRIVVNK